jgi:Flp pilus assembly protein TadG
MLRKWLSFGNRARPGRRRGSSMVEFALLMPWYAFLFVGAYDFGFYCYGLIATQNAARLAALYCSGSSSLATNCSTRPEACDYARFSLQMMPNVGTSLLTCVSPIVLTSSVITPGVTGDATSAIQVTVAYTTPTLIPIPGLVAGGMTISRTVIMKVVT